MTPHYHAVITAEAVGKYFDKPALRQIVVANIAQDSISSLFGARPEVHFDDDLVAAGLGYVETEHRRIAALAAQTGTAAAQRAAFGRLCHTAQDLYAHSNYVRLWLDAHGGLQATRPEDMDALDAGILGSSKLKTGHYAFWHFLAYSIPGVSWVMRRIGVPPGSHEAMNLDKPSRGPEFPYAFAAARARTEHEYRRAAAAVLANGGQAALDLFHRSLR